MGDVGGGDHDVTTTWLRLNRGVQEALVLDPFCRSADHNQQVQNRILENGGADVVASISVLNVVPEVSNRMRHLVLLHHILKDGGYAFFKVWPGMWPERGMGKQSYDASRGLTQENKWATAFFPEVEAAFGAGNVHCDANLNLIVAHKASNAKSVINSQGHSKRPRTTAATDGVLLLSSM